MKSYTIIMFIVGLFIVMKKLLEKVKLQILQMQSTVVCAKERVTYKK